MCSLIKVKGLGKGLFCQMKPFWACCEGGK
jgi:hypothetical protein